MINTQTAIEWLIDQLIQLDKELDGRRKNQDSTVLKLNPTDLYEKAKQMEKYEMCTTLKELLGKIDQFTGMKTTMKDQGYYQELEKMLVKDLREVILKRITR